MFGRKARQKLLEGRGEGVIGGTTTVLSDEFLNVMDPIDLDVLDAAVMTICEEEESAPSSSSSFPDTGTSSSSVGYTQTAVQIIKSIGLYLWEAIQSLCIYVWDRLQILGILAQQYAKIAWEDTKRRLEEADLRTKWDITLDWLHQHLMELYRQAHSFLLVQYDIWVHHSSTAWIQEKTGYPPDLIVQVLSGTLAFLLVSILYRLISAWRRRRSSHHLRRGRRGALEPSLSITFGNPDTSRGARDRGFSLDLSATQSTDNANTWNNRASTIRENFIDLFRMSRKNPMGSGGGDGNPSGGGKGVRERGNSFDLQGFGDDLTNPNHAIGSGSGGGSSDDARPAATARILPATVIYYGPTESTLLYSTWTPPPSWTEASRSLMPHDTRMKLQREISLDLSKDKCMMSIREPTSQERPLMLAVSACSIHVKPPLIGGILELYVKDSSKEEWMEHTFETARNAAQFQIDMLAIQLFGPALNRMYQSLELIHQGSMACEGREYVCHHDQMSDENPQGVGVAWDDAMRALGSNVPSLRVALERLWWQHYSTTSLKLRNRKRKKKNKKQDKGTGNGGGVSSNSSVGSAPPDEEEGGTTPGDDADADKKDNVPTKNQNEWIHLSKDYVRKRLLLGPVDFFRLFVPCVPETALPNNESNKKRMVQLLRWRKRAATAAILTQSYVKARIVANKGWVLSRPLPTHYLTRRLAFDDNIDNSHRDTVAKNEYYEATVSRDVLTFVRPNEPDAFKPRERWWEHFRPRRIRTSISKYQAHALIGHHVFKIPQDDNFPLKPENDPVLTFGSLRQLVESNPDLDFLCLAFFPELAEVCYINVFVRSLARGVDAAFDRNMSRFKHGSKEIRDKKLSIMMQLGSSENKTFSERCAIKMVTHLMQSVAEDLDASTPNAELGPSDRTPFPIIPLSRFGETHHFGGSLQVSRKQPQNYCAATVDMRSNKAAFNPFARLLMSLIERGFLSKSVYDITYVLAANEQDELPERALASLRLARVAARDIALPSIFVYGSNRRDFKRRSTWDANNFKSVLGNVSSIGDRLRVMENFWDDDSEYERPSNVHRVSTASERQRKRQRAEALLNRRKVGTVFTEDPIEKAVNELVEILGSVKVPVRRDQLPLYDFAAAVPLSLLEAHSATDGTLNNKELLNMSLLLLVTRGDIKRHYIASGCNLTKAAIRIVETAAWRGQTFPIDKRLCRIELQSGQFFQQGTDLMGRPVFYFRNMGLGPWRRDNDASVAAVLDRLEGALWEFVQHDDACTCTLVIIMGKPFRANYFKKKGNSDTASVDGDEEDDDEMDASSIMSMSFKDCNEQSPDGKRVANPRVNPDEVWQLHTSKKLLRQMITLISAHYPERLHQALVVVKPSQVVSLRKLMGSWRLSQLVQSPVTRSKVKFLNSFQELQGYISKQELVTIAGGERPVNPEVFGLPDC